MAININAKRGVNKTLIGERMTSGVVVGAESETVFSRVRNMRFSYYTSSEVKRLSVCAVDSSTHVDALGHSVKHTREITIFYQFIYLFLFYFCFRFVVVCMILEWASSMFVNCVPRVRSRAFIVLVTSVALICYYLHINQ
jgi:hypothetical protein